MKIAHVVDSMEVGGAEMLVSQLCRLQKDEGHSPSIFAIAALGVLGEQLQREGFKVQPDVGRHLLDSTRSFYQIFKESKLDVVHLHNPTPTIYAATAARIAGVPTIVSTRHSLVAPPRKMIAELKYAIAARSCDWIVGICDATAMNLRSMHTVPSRKIVRVYNGAAPIVRVAGDHCPPKDGFTLIYVGRLEPVKNHALLLNGFRIAMTKMPDLRLWMVGDGSLRQYLENLAKELGIEAQVSFWGQQLDVAPFFSSADAFIMSSSSEGLPMSLLQAFSLGLPAIVTNVGGMAEAVSLAKAGLTVPVTSPEELAVAILSLAGDEEKRERYSSNAAAAFTSHFSLKTMADGYMQLYRTTKRARSDKS